MAKMTAEEMDHILIVHEIAEFDNDVEAVMATLADNPQYELPNMGWHIKGEVAVRELYNRWLSGADKRNIWAEKRVQAYSADGDAMIRDAFVFYDNDAGERVTSRYSTAFSFENGKISGERMFMEPPFAKVMNDILGPDFGEIEGVSRIETMGPPPVPRLDRAAEHAARPNH
ncbi:hypothetical protein ACP6C7_13995 [Mycolicibacterium septicum]|uniref:SnoaL-like domain-containing protein n=1 Tax=Mycolicibacterium septicum TaxID=98668 RepID=A0ABW9LZI7_9MYCO